MLRLTLLSLLTTLQFFSLEVQINKPLYQNNSVTTTSGGVVSEEGLRIQARNIHYTFLENEKNFIVASEDLFLQIEGKSYVASKIEYDFTNKEGTLYDLKTQKGEVYHGAKIAKIKNKKVFLEEPFTYIGEDQENKAEISASKAEVLQSKEIKAENVNAKIGNNSILTLPKASLILTTLKHP